MGPLLALLALFACLPRVAGAQSLTLEPIATGLTRPVDIAHAGDGSGRLFLVQQGGRVLIHDGSGVLPTPFLDIGSLISCCGERGLLGLAFHPSYASNGFLFVFYTNTFGAAVVARYQVSSNPNLADAGSANILLTVPQPETNHNGGQLRFGPDGYLYIALGDGGGGGDPWNNGQNTNTLLGTILRIDVDGGTPYAIPSGNPFVGVSGTLPEIWAYGLRNPWRFSFDRQTGDMFIADVGQGAREEVSFQPAGSPGGENYGWNVLEGSRCYPPQTTSCDSSSTVLPIIEYGHGNGDCSITGGFRYRGAQLPPLSGRYLYADFCTGRIWTSTEAGATWTSYEGLDTTARFSTFGEDEAGELYIADLTSSVGAVYRIGFTTPGDHDGDRHADILWRNAVSGSTILWQMDGFLREDFRSIGAPDPDWEIQGLADFNADSKTDILWRNTATGNVIVWLMDGFTKLDTGGAGSAGPDWRVVGTGDFDADNRDDVLWRNTTTGTALIWKMDGTLKTDVGGLGAVPSVWEVAGVGDFDADGTSDILWRHTIDGNTVVWKIVSLAKASSAGIGAPNTDWQVRGVGHFDRDGHADILWQNTANARAVFWKMDDLRKEASAGLGPIPSPWAVDGVGDTDGDGQSDIIWRDTGSGEAIVWRIDTLAEDGAQSIGNVPPVWQIQ